MIKNKLLLAFAFCLCVGSLDSVSAKCALKSAKYKHIILIGFDGLSSYSLNHGAQMPMFQKMMKEGAYTLENRSVLPSSSAVNWASMFMGAGPELHGYTEWGSKVPELPSRVLNKNRIFPDIYSCIRLKYPKSELGYFYEWEGMKYLVDTLALSTCKQVQLSEINTKVAVAPVVKYINEKKPMFCAVVFAEPDGAGHSKGWESDDYLQMVNNLDKALAEIVKAVENAGILDETLFILSSDHGGNNCGHGGKTMKEMQTPIVFWGNKVNSGSYIKESTMVFDIASTIGYLLDIQQPQVWIGRPIKSAFSKK